MIAGELRGTGLNVFFYNSPDHNASAGEVSLEKGCNSLFVITKDGINLNYHFKRKEKFHLLNDPPLPFLLRPQLPG